MRRLALSVFAACGFVALVACGGTGLGGSTTANVVEFTGSSGQSNQFFVSPTSATPLEINAVATDGGALLSTGQSFTWAARFINPKTDPASIASYLTGSPSANQPTASKPCPSEPTTTPAIPILLQTPGATSITQYPGYAALGTAQTSPTVFIGAVPGIAAATSYCLLVIANDISSGARGSVTVFVGNSP